MVRLQILSGKNAGKVVEAERFPFRIGRGATCDLSVEEPGVWDEHLDIRLEYPSGFEATVHEEALASLNDRHFKSSPLRNGDVLSLGSLKLTFSLSPTRSRGLRLREWMTWMAIVALFLGQLVLIYAIPN